MSWSEHLRRTFHRVVVPGMLFGVVVLTSACGFQPLYGRPSDGGPSATDRFAQIRIAPLPDRIGQRMHNLLLDRLNPKGQPSSPDYGLEVRLREVIQELGIRKDETATRANLRLTAAFTLLDAHTGAKLLSGESRSVNSYNILQSQFATLFSEDDARERSLREVSDDIRTRLGIYFAGVASRGS